MKKETLAIWQKGEYQYPLAFGFVPKLVSYFHEEGEQARPCMLVVPGGAYCVVSPTEGEIVAMEFYEKGYNAFVLTYTTNPLILEPLKDQPMRDLSRAIRFIRSRAGEFCIDPDRLVICGFSFVPVYAFTLQISAMRFMKEYPTGRTPPFFPIR